MSDAEPISLPGEFRPTSGTMEAWNAAYVRVEDYLRAHRLQNRLHASRLILRVLERAAKRHAENPRLDPTSLAAEEVEQEMDTWFADMLDERDQPHDRIAVDGRVALLLCDGPQKWPYAFLEKGVNAPVEFAEAMRKGALTAGPDMAVSSMVPRPIDLGPISEAAGETLERFEQLPLLRTLFLWLLFAGVLAVIFYATR
ncbi:hypothetical protein [Opitutus terrae]|uniref:Transmembrane protein n=1 Tax=Opitutus terrae (strain DSM 11246 / JCM 15787 / PB90-1) TaxID=452637 RepID=B1ZZ64_OPITP|nr:hypothetical protein [Opitutus terrae]ACB77136.1 hypothetical protein Oter_3862 [Opitutus terrae PB90-1]